MRRLLLVSTSTTHGTGYLDHCADQARSQFGGANRVLFFPYALFDREGYAGKARERFERMGFGLDSIHEAASSRAAVERAEGIFIGGGNTFRLLNALYEEDLLDAVRARVRAGVPYMGTSAGSNVACPTIMTTNDMPIVRPPSFDGLNLVPFQINPHYLDPDPGSTHMGETRETRIREYLEENDRVVIGLREGSMIRVDGDRAVLTGERGARIFRRNHDPEEASPGADLSSLLLKPGRP